MVGQVGQDMKDPGTRSSIRTISNEPEMLLTLATGYYSAAFPNPERLGCVPLRKVAEAISSGVDTSGDWYRHLFKCSECFREYAGVQPHVRALLKSGAGKFVMYEYLESIGFFTPSDTLTMGIITKNRELAHLDRLEMPHEEHEGEVVDPDYRPKAAERQAKDAGRRWREFVERYKETVWRKTQNDPEKRESLSRQSQLAIADSLYGYLAVLSRRPQARAGEPYDLWMVISRGMGSRLGLMRPVGPNERVQFEAHKYEMRDADLFDEFSYQLLLKLTDEFSSWLGSHQGTYKAQWGDITLKGSHHLVLRARQREKRQRPQRPYVGDAKYESSSPGLGRRLRK
jgi:hypothetical protein